MVAVHVDDGRIGIGDDRNVVFLAVDDALAVSVRADPISSQLLGGKVNAQCVLFRFDASFDSLRPGENLVTAADDAIIARGSDDVGIGRWQRDSHGFVLLLGHHADSAAVGFSLYPYNSPKIAVA